MKQLLCILTLALALVACNNGETVTPVSFFKANRPNEFTFTTSQTVDIALNYGRRAEVELYVQDPSLLDTLGTIVPFLSGYTDLHGRLNFRVVIPDAAAEVYALSPTRGCPLLLRSVRQADGTFSAFENLNRGEGTRDIPANARLDLVTLRQSGIVAFEDNFPNAGDWDMNDVMLSYLRSIEVNHREEVERVTDEWEFVCDGAGFKNAFGYELFGEINPADSTKCTITRNDVRVDVECAGRGFECLGIDTELDPATVMLFDNINAVPMSAYWRVNTTFRRTVGYSEIIRLNHTFNPFIVVNGYLEKRRVEVHPAYHAPTSKFNYGLFGQGDDKSDPQRGIYFVRNQLQGYPFAIHIMGNCYRQPNGAIYVMPDFPIPEETIVMNNTYPNFAKWYESNGKDHKEWYRK